MRKSILSILLLGFMVFSFSGCDGDFGDINTNPLDPSQVSDGAIFNGIAASLRLGWSRQLFLNNEALYDVTEQAVVTAKTFGNVSGGSEEMWTDYYQALKNANELYARYSNNSVDPEIADIKKAQLDVLMAYKTFQLTDLYGDIPYSEAGRIFQDDESSRPSYDSQEDIYKTLIDQLITAVETFKKSKTSLDNNFDRYGTFETLFDDNLDKWIRFSNSLQLRHLVRMYDKDEAFASPRIKTFIESGENTIVKGGDAVMMPRDQLWLNLGVNWSFREHNKVRLGTTFWNYLTEDGNIIDPRMNIFYEPNVNEDWVAFPQISDSNTPQSGGEPYQKDRRDGNHPNKGDNNIYASVNFFLIRDELDIPEILISAAEVQFLRAEIFLRGMGITADPFLALSAYESGFLSSLEFWQGLMENSEAWRIKSPILSIGELYQTVQHPKYFFDVNDNIENNLSKIYGQRWVDTFRQPWEAFSLLRRTNQLPREKSENQFFRFEYPPSESALNADNYSNQVSQMGSDATNVKVWWMK